MVTETQEIVFKRGGVMVEGEEGAQDCPGAGCWWGGGAQPLAEPLCPLLCLHSLHKERSNNKVYSRPCLYQALKRNSDQCPASMPRLPKVQSRSTLGFSKMRSIPECL